MDDAATLAWLRQKAEEQDNAAQHLGPDFGGSCRTAADALSSAANLIESISFKLDQLREIVRGDWGINVSTTINKIIDIVDPRPECVHVQNVVTARCVHCNKDMRGI